MVKILLVEDNADIANMVRTFLLFEHHTVETIADGLEAHSLLKSFAYDLIILDWQLPGMSGIDICKEYRSARGKTPVLMLTGKDSINDKILGLDSGADDYLTKPFDLRELGGRIRALLRRPTEVLPSNCLTAGNLSLDPAKHLAMRDGEPVALVPREFQLFEFLMRHQNQVFTAEALLNRVWPSESAATEEALRIAMKRLRKKIDPDSKLLRNVHGVGYILEVPQ
jgi:DNA-binding response OmpR family regulator